MQTTIYALATGSPPCAVAIIRVSGPLAGDVARAFCGGAPEPRHAAYRLIRDPADGEVIDQGLVLFFPGPGSFTGEDCLEFQIHGSRAVVARLFRALAALPGLRPAEPGEFIRRAFENDRLALSTVEGVADLVDARTELQRRQALAQAGGRLADAAELWREEMLTAAALLEAEIDFADEGEAPSGVLAEVRAIAGRLAAQMRDALVDAERGERIRNGFRVVIAGPPNAGKSTLMNALARRDVAIVSTQAGTTRDVLDVELDLGGAPVVLSDTAGIRDTSDEVETIGIDRAQAALRGADLVLWLEPSDAAPSGSPEVGENVLRIATKADLADQTPAWADLSISVRANVGLGLLVERIGAAARDLLGGEPALITQERQRHCLAEATRHLDVLLSGHRSEIELVAEDLRLAIRSVEMLIGRVGVEDVLGSIFSRFCMGK